MVPPKSGCPPFARSHVVARAQACSRRRPASMSATTCSATESPYASDAHVHTRASSIAPCATHRSTPAQGSCTQRTPSCRTRSSSEGSWSSHTIASASSADAGSPPPSRTASRTASSIFGPTWILSASGMARQATRNAPCGGCRTSLVSAPLQDLERLAELAESRAPTERKRMLLIINPYATSMTPHIRTLVLYALQGRYDVDAVDTPGPRARDGAVPGGRGRGLRRRGLPRRRRDRQRGGELPSSAPPPR